MRGPAGGTVALGRAVAAATTPALLLAIRLWLGQAFLLLHMAMAVRGQALTAVFHAAWWAGLAEAVAASGPGALIGTLAPVLLVLGLASREAGCALLLQVWLLRAPGETPSLAALWTGLLLVVVMLGPGAFSLDGLLGPGLRRAPLPGRRAMRALRRWATVLGEPAYLLALRLVLAVWLLASHAEPGGAMQRAAMAHLPAVPGLLGVLPEAVAGVGAGLLALGVATRPVSLALLLLAPVGMAPMAGDARLSVLLLLAVLFARGAGAVSVDQALAASFAGPRPPQAGARPRVVIVGAGFAGLAAARGLRGAPCEVTLIDRRNHHLFQPLLYQVATAGLAPADIATPVRSLLRKQDNISVVLGEVRGVDTAARTVRLDDLAIGYDILVLATGARHSYFGNDCWAAWAPGLKSVEDALAIRARVLTAFEAAERTEDAAARAAWLTFVVVGAGPTGVELAGAIAELARHGLAGEFRRIDPASARVLLVQSGDRVLPAFSPAISRRAAMLLGRLGVELLLGAAAETVGPEGVRIAATFVPARTVLWAAGVMASPAGRWLDAPCDRAGRVIVGPDLSVAGWPEVFATGDTAAAEAWRGRPMPGLAPAAKQSGAYVAKVVRARLAGRRAPPPFRYRHYGSLATIGREAAVAEFGRLRVTGGLAWWLWGALHILFLADGRNRTGVVLEWLWDYLTLRRGSRLITSVMAER